MRFFFACALAFGVCACGPNSVPTDGGADSGRACSPPDLTDYRNVLAPARLPRCTEDTRRCASSCGEDSVCVAQCLAMDSTPAFSGGGMVISCASCVSHQQTACLANRGCGDVFATAQCCPTVHGLSPSDREGIEAVCGSSIRAFATCQSDQAPGCYELTEPEVAACFGSVTDAGLIDAHVDAEVDSSPSDAGTGG